VHFNILRSQEWRLKDNVTNITFDLVQSFDLVDLFMANYAQVKKPFFGCILSYCFPVSESVCVWGGGRMEREEL